jgi:hypothetical protein
LWELRKSSIDTDQEYNMFVFLSAYNLARAEGNASVSYDSQLWVNRIVEGTVTSNRGRAAVISAEDGKLEKSPEFALAAGEEELIAYLNKLRDKKLL